MSEDAPAYGDAPVVGDLMSAQRRAPSAFGTCDHLGGHKPGVVMFITDDECIAIKALLSSRRNAVERRWADLERTAERNHDESFASYCRQRKGEETAQFDSAIDILTTAFNRRATHCFGLQAEDDRGTA